MRKRLFGGGWVVGRSRILRYGRWSSGSHGDVEMSSWCLATLADIQLRPTKLLWNVEGNKNFVERARETDEGKDETDWINEHHWIFLVSRIGARIGRKIPHAVFWYT